MSCTAFFIKNMFAGERNVSVGTRGRIFEVVFAISCGSSICVAPTFSSSEILNERLITSGMLSAFLTDQFHFVIGLNIVMTSIF